MELGTDLALGSSGDLTISPTGDLALVTGVANVRGALVRRLLRSPGELLWAPTYGGGLVAGVETLNAPGQRAVMAQLGRRNLLRDHRVVSAEVTVRAVAGQPQRVEVDLSATLITGVSTRATTEA